MVCVGIGIVNSRMGMSARCVACVGKCGLKLEYYLCGECWVNRCEELIGR